MRFRKSQGLTESEVILARLCERSFLRLWTYPNLFKQPGKELIDLMVVFENTVLLFSDKSCAYPDTGDQALDWARWYRRAIAKSALQAASAKKWVVEYPASVFLDAKASQHLPVALPNTGQMSVHLIIVSTGASTRCALETGQPSLGLDLTVSDSDTPFKIGQISRAHGPIHVFDENSLELLLTELDTIKDFVAYLDNKDLLLAGGRFQAAMSEADILAYYLANERSFPPEERDFVLEPDLWAKVEQNAGFQAGRALNNEHRFWDNLIEYITANYLEEGLEYGNEIEMNDYERLARLMASETRFRRRILSQIVLERAGQAQAGRISTLLPSDQDDVLYVLLIGEGANREEYAGYREHRMRELHLRCLAAKVVRPEVRFIVGLGLDALGVVGGAEDFIYLDTAEWTEEAFNQAGAMRNALGFFLEDRIVVQNLHADEYPAIE